MGRILRVRPPEDRTSAPKVAQKMQPRNLRIFGSGKEGWRARLQVFASRLM